MATAYHHCLLSQAELDAHDSGIQCLEYCSSRNQAATCGMGAKVKVWSLNKPTQPTLTLVLDHSDPLAAAAKQPPPSSQQQESEAAAASTSSTPSTAAADVNPAGKSNMRWLIKSELAEGSSTTQQEGRKGGVPLPDIVAEAIAHAADDVPEVTQVTACSEACCIGCTELMPCVHIQKDCWADRAL